MPFKNYYVILGVPRGESQAGIRARYRDLVKRLHPDVAGESSTAAFQEIEEAYDVLSDPEHRRRYNRDLTAREGTSAPRTRFSPPSRPFGPEVSGAPVSLHDFQTVRPSVEALFERILRNFTGAGVPKSEQVEPLIFEVILSPEEAAGGGVIPIEIPVFRPCHRCRGTGRDWMFVCPYCAGGGLVTEERVLEVSIPPIRHSTEIRDVSLRALGIGNLHLRLFLRVS